jgi:hypothetical protein
MRVPALLSEEVPRNSNFRLGQTALAATIAELSQCEPALEIYVVRLQPRRRAPPTIMSYRPCFSSSYHVPMNVHHRQAARMHHIMTVDIVGARSVSISVSTEAHGDQTWPFNEA